MGIQYLESAQTRIEAVAFGSQTVASMLKALDKLEASYEETYGSETGDSNRLEAGEAITFNVHSPGGHCSLDGIAVGYDGEGYTATGWDNDK